MLQLLDLARENAALKRELCRIRAEAEALQRLVAATCASAESCTALIREVPHYREGERGWEPQKS